MGNVGINSVGTESVNQTGQAGRIEYLASVLQEGLTCENSRDTAVSIWPDSSHSSHVQGICFLSQDA